MNPTRLIRHFDDVCQTSESVDVIRRLILDLAVQGKLLEQNLQDEPASVLIEQIEGEKRRCYEAGEVSSIEPANALDEAETPFTIPAGWVAVRMGALARKLGAGSTPRGGRAIYQRDGIPFLRSQNVHNYGLELEGVARIPNVIHERMSGTHVLPSDILLNITGASIGRCALVHDTFDEGNVSQHVAIIRLFDSSIREFIHLSLISPAYQNLIMSEQVGVSREGLSMRRLKRFPMVLPPLAEQHRIVAKVDELMALCDELEAAQAKREARRDRLVAATLHRLNNGDATQPGEAPSWKETARFYFNHLPRLTTRPEHIRQLRQTILNLAVKGKLVPQDPTDEPASRLLVRISEEKRRIKSGGRKIVSKAEMEDGPHPVPVNWAWARWETIALKIGDIDHRMPETVKEGVPYVSPRDFLPDNKIDFDGAKMVSLNDFNRLARKIKPDQGDIIYPRYGTIGENRLVTVQRDFLASYSCAVIKVLVGFVNPKYQYFFSVSDTAKSQAKAAENKTTQANVGIKSIKQFKFPLPPLAEQHRIVAKVDELMALCDELESRLTETAATRRRLLEATLQEALASA